MKPMKLRYSGPMSNPFWTRVNRLERGGDVMYALGCVLQNTEEYVLTQLDNYERSTLNEKPKRGKP